MSDYASKDKLIKAGKRAYKDVECYQLGDLIIQQQGEWLGIGYVYGMRENLFWISWQIPGEQVAAMRSYAPEEVKAYIGSKKWNKVERQK